MTRFFDRSTCRSPSVKRQALDPTGVVGEPARRSGAKESRWARSSAQADVDVGSIGAVTITTLDPPASLAHGRPRAGALCQARGMDSQNPYADRPWLAAYAPEVPDAIDEVTQTLSDMIDASIARYGRARALEFFGAATTYAELGEQIDRAAEGLRRLGVTHGDRVAIVLPNCPQHVVAFYAVLRLGAIVVEHNPLYTARELRHQFEDHQARFAIVWDKVYDTVDGFPSDLKVERIVSVDITEAMPWGTRFALRLPVAKARTARAQLTATPKARKVLTWQKLVDGRRLSRRHPRPVLDDIALLQYTSGTTGTPKGAILTHRNLRANAMQGARLGARAARGRGDLLRGAAAVPRLRHDAVPHVRDEHRREARAVPEVRREARGGCREEEPADLPARGAADLRPARPVGGARRDRPDERALRDLGRDEPAGRDRRRGGRRRPAACSSRATA